MAVGIGIAYDACLSPVDVRSLTLSRIKGSGIDRWIETARKKTGEVQKHALSEDTCARLGGYLAAAAEAKITFKPEEEILRQPDGWRLYTKDRWEKHFRWTRDTALPGDARRLMDMRRTGNVEADLGGMSRADRGELLANGLGKNNFLERTYTPATVVKSRQSLQKRQEARALLEAEAAFMRATQGPDDGTSD
ncbi:MAG: hypothetical protein AB7O04_01745 [Hyphomonadaceae bacterium]